MTSGAAYALYRVYPRAIFRKRCYDYQLARSRMRACPRSTALS